MGGLAALLFLPFLAYAIVQTGRDVRSKAWPMAAWGLVTILFAGWIILRLMSGPQH